MGINAALKQPEPEFNLQGELVCKQDLPLQPPTGHHSYVFFFLSNLRCGNEEINNVSVAYVFSPLPLTFDCTVN